MTTKTPGIRLFNTLSREIETFEPQKPGKVSIYNCGPTVYDTPHIGNYRTFVMADILRRAFEYNDYEVTQVMNVTDVDDKTIRRARSEKVSLQEVTVKYEKLFLLGLASLNVKTPHHLIRATAYIDQMIRLVSELLAKGVAYKADDGVYVDISKVEGYGWLARLDLKSASKSRVANDEYDKENARDFAVWKFQSPDDGETHWKAPFGEGRPGWHIECSAMSMEKLGPTIDIHTGGQDLIFPHHVNEIAQSESVTGRQFVRYWVHGAFMNVNADKMAKSKGNFIKLETLAEEHISPLAFRYWLMTAHYRSPVNFTYESVRAAQTALIKFLSAFGSFPDGGQINREYAGRFKAFVNDDMDMPKAVALSWELIKAPDSEVSDADKRATLLDFDRVLGLDLARAPRLGGEPAEAVPPEIAALADAREEARGSKDWSKADALRAEARERGYDIQDTSSGPRIVPL